MTIEEKLKNLIVERYGAVLYFSQKIGVSNSTVNSILTRGIHNASIDSIVKICKGLNISADALAQEQIIPTKWEEENIELVTVLTNLRMRITAQDVTIAGDAVSENEKELIIDSLEMIEKLIDR